MPYNQLAPIVLFVYNRVTNVKALLDSLAANELAKESVLYIYSDGPKEGASEEEVQEIKEVREHISAWNICRDVHIVESVRNLGCGPSIILGITEIVNKYGKVIILEDDLKLSPFFLNYINDGLRLYEKKLNVGAIGGCNFFACGDRFPPSFFSQYPESWGWGTWADRWQFFEPDAVKLLKQLREAKLIRQFNGYGAFDMETLLLAQINNHVSTWDIQWTAICTLKGWLTLYPNPAMSQHVFMEDATHTPLNIMPPLAEKKIELREVDVCILPQVRKAMKLGYSGKGDFYGNRIKVPVNKLYFINKAREYFHAFKKMIRPPGIDGAVR